jgi:hypothetical protein
VRALVREEEERSVVTMVAVTAAVAREERGCTDWRRTLTIAAAKRLMGWCGARQSGGRGQSRNGTAVAEWRRVELHDDCNGGTSASVLHEREREREREAGRVNEGNGQGRGAP